MTGAMDTQIDSAPQPSKVSQSAPPPAPPPPPGCSGSVQLPHWRSEPLPAHLAPTKEEIEKEQYAHLPDKLLNTLNKDKKPFTYTPSGVSGTEKGKLDLSSIRSPKMRKRLMANVADDEEVDQFDTDRVTRSETPEVVSRPQLNHSRRAITPDVVSMNRQIYAPVLPPTGQTRPFNDNRPGVAKPVKSSTEFDSFIQKQMQEMENSLKKKNNLNGLEPEVQELIDSYANQRTVPINVEQNSSEHDLIDSNVYYNAPEYTQPFHVEQTVPSNGYKSPENNNFENERMDSSRESDENIGINCSNDRNSNRNDSKRENNYSNTNKTSNSWDSDLLKHVLDGGLQEEIEKFEQISLETQKSFSPNPNRIPYLQNDCYYETPTFETFNRVLPNPAPVWSPPNHYEEPYGGRSQSSQSFQSSNYGSLNRNNTNRNGTQTPQPFQSNPEPIGRRYWSASSSPSPHPTYDDYSSVQPIHRSANIPSNQYRTGIAPSEVPNYNCRPKPFYLCSEPPTPTATPPPQFMPQHQPIHGHREQEFTTFGKNQFRPQKVNYQNEIRDSEPMPELRYLDNMGMYSQIRTVDGWESPSPGPNSSPQIRSLDRNIKFSERLITSPERTGFKSPEPPKPILKKKLPPSERPPDPTPSKYMGANIPSRSFRFLQLMTGEDIDNQFIDEKFKENRSETRIKPNNPSNSCKQFNRTIGYSNYEDFGTDF